MTLTPVRFWALVVQILSVGMMLGLSFPLAPKLLVVAVNITATLVLMVGLKPVGR